MFYSVNSKKQGHQALILKIMYFNAKDAVINTNKIQDKHTVERNNCKLRNQFIGAVWYTSKQQDPCSACKRTSHFVHLRRVLRWHILHLPCE